MKTIDIYEDTDNIHGLTCEKVNGKRVVKFNGQICPLINRRQELCECDTSYNGEVLDSWETYQTPIGVVERHFWQRGPGLERSGTDWRLVPVTEIEEHQKHYETLSIQLADAREMLESVTTELCRKAMATE